MEILSPEKIKEDTTKRITEQRDRTKLANEEEALALARLNAAHDAEEEEAQRREAKAEEKIGPLEEKKNALEREVIELEGRKIQALKPIESREEEVAKREILHIEKENELVSRETALKEAENKVTDRLERLQDSEDNLIDRTEKVREREIAIEKAEDENKRQALALGDKWEEFHTMTARQKDWIAEKEAEVDAGKKANQIKLEEMQLKESDLDLRDKAVTDKYNTMVMSARQWEKDHPEAPKILEE